MNDLQRKILIAVAALIGLMLLYPPFQVMGRGLGYSLIFSPPIAAATINAGQLLVQWVAVASIGGIAFVLSKKSRAPPTALLKSVDAAIAPPMALLNSTANAILEPTNNTQESSDQFPGYPLYEAIVGEKNRDRYLTKFNNFSRQPSELTAGWNWSAFLFGGVWALYRKIYVWFIGFTVLYFISNFVEKGAPIFGALLLFVPSVAFGVYADAYYYRDAKDKIAAASDFNDPTALLDHLRKKGGVHTWVLWLSIALPVFGIFASILIPRFLTTISL